MKLLPDPGAYAHESEGSLEIRGSSRASGVMRGLTVCQYALKWLRLRRHQPDSGKPVYPQLSILAADLYHVGVLLPGHAVPLLSSDDDLRLSPLL